MSGRIAKSQIPIKPQASLPADVTIAIIEAKNLLKAGKPLRRFANTGGNSPLEGPPLPDPALGHEYFEKQVGQARPGDPMGEKGSKRLVLEVNTKSGQIAEIYYSPEHYSKFTFYRLV